MLEIDIPDPGHVGAVGTPVVQADEKVMAAGEVDGGAQRFVEPGRVFRQHEVDAASFRLETLLPPEGGVKAAKAVGHECAVKAECGAGREGRDNVVRVVQAAERQLDAGAAHVHGEAVESVELDFGRRDLGRGPREVSIGAAIHAVVAHVDRVEYQARAAMEVSSSPNQIGLLSRCMPISATRGSSALSTARLPLGKRASAFSIRLAIDSSSP